MKKILIPLTFILAFGACSMSPTITDQTGNVKSIGPEWAENPGKWEAEHKGTLAFVGISTVQDEEMARTDAKFNALSSLADRVRTDIHHLFVAGMTSDEAPGESATERAIDNGVLGVSRAAVGGAHVDKYRVFFRKTSAGVTFTTYALIEMPAGEYSRTVANTLDEIRKEVQDPRARDLVNEMKKRFLSRKSS